MLLLLGHTIKAPKHQKCIGLGVIRLKKHLVYPQHHNPLSLHTQKPSKVSYTSNETTLSLYSWPVFRLTLFSVAFPFNIVTLYIEFDLSWPPDRVM